MKLAELKRSTFPLLNAATQSFWFISHAATQLTVFLPSARPFVAANGNEGVWKHFVTNWQEQKSSSSVCHWRQKWIQQWSDNVWETWKVGICHVFVCACIFTFTHFNWSASITNTSFATHSHSVCWLGKVNDRPSYHQLNQIESVPNGNRRFEFESCSYVAIKCFHNFVLFFAYFYFDEGIKVNRIEIITWDHAFHAVFSAFSSFCFWL